MVYVAVGAGGALGAVLRMVIGGWVQSGAVRPGAFPWGTFVVNLTGCLAIGLCVGLLQKRGLGESQVQAMVLVGLLGGYTTFSTFALETLGLIHQGSYGAALANGVGAPILGVVGVVLGDALSRWV